MIFLQKSFLSIRSEEELGRKKKKKTVLEMAKYDRNEI